MNASMNRHFVFNSLNSIQYFINTQDRISANKYLTNFAKLIRKNLDTATVDGNMITLEEELERLELYLSLESMRFKDRFDYEISAKGVETDSILIPAMILQPFVENSIIHGILPNQEKKGKISLTVEEENGYLLLAVEDNGIGVNQSITKKVDMEGDHRSKGMEITSKRIDLIQKISNNDISLVGPYEVYNDDRSIKGTRVLLKIPLNNLEN
jgi:LytS/YehU family sensor histidine kinase